MNKKIPGTRDKTQIINLAVMVCLPDGEARAVEQGLLFALSEKRLITL